MANSGDPFFKTRSPRVSGGKKNLRVAVPPEAETTGHRCRFPAPVSRRQPLLLTAPHRMFPVFPAVPFSTAKSTTTTKATTTAKLHNDSEDNVA